MKVVCNASPLIGLAILGRLDLPVRLYGTVIVSNEVAIEISVPDKPFGLELKSWAQSKIVPVNNRIALLTLTQMLDIGEASTIILSEEQSADFVIMDDRKGRRIAEARNIKVVGLMAVLIDAFERKMIPSLQAEIKKLQAAGYRLSKSLIEESLKIAGER